MLNSCFFARALWVFAAAAGLLAGVPGYLVQAAEAQPYAEVRLTVDLRELSLNEALETVADLAGQDLEIVGAADHERKVSISLRDATLQESLEKILRPGNYVILWLPENRLRVYLLDGQSDDGTRVTQTAAPVEELYEEPVSLFPGGKEVLPPSLPGEPGLTIADLNYYRSFATDFDPAEIEVLPPLSSEEDGLTQADIKFFSAMHQVPEPADIEVIPPKGEDEFSLTLAEFEAMRSNRPALSPSQIEVVPPDLPGEIGLTLEQLNTQAKSPPAAATLVDMVPPDWLQ